MLYIVKTIISALVIVLVTEISKRSSALGAFFLALPIVSITAIVWIWMETKDAEKIANLTYDTFWYVLPTLPMFLMITWMLRNQYNFYLSLAICCVITAILFATTQYLLAK